MAKIIQIARGVEFCGVRLLPDSPCIGKNAIQLTDGADTRAFQRGSNKDGVIEGVTTYDRAGQPNHFGVVIVESRQEALRVVSEVNKDAEVIRNQRTRV